MQQSFKCPQCSAEFPTQQALNEHIEKEHLGVKLTPPEQDDPATSSEFPGDETLENSGAYEPEVPATEQP